MTEIELRKSFLNWLKENTPSGTRISVESDGFVSVKLLCAGQVPHMAYWCSLEPGHKGQCYSKEKCVDFTPVVGK